MIKDEFIDEELQKIGVRFTDETMAPTPEGPAENAQWEYAPQPAPEWHRRLKGCAKWVAVCGGIGALLLFFQQNDLMAVEAAFPCICACMTLVGYGVGKHTAEGRNGT